MVELFARKVVIAVLVVLLAASGVLVAIIAKHDEPKVIAPKVLKDGQYRIGTIGDAETQAALKAAVETVPAALSYDYRTLDKSLKAATAGMTPGFAAEFADTFDKVTRARAVQKQAITSSLVRAAGVIGTVGNGRATVLIYLDQVLIGSKDKKARDPLKVSQNRVHVSLRSIKGKWRVSDIEPF